MYDILYEVVMLTDFGKMLKKLMVDEGINQEQLAHEISISPGILSRYMSGKNIPEMSFIEKCIKRFKLRNGKIRDIFTKTFSSTAQANYSIHLDTRFFKRERLNLLAEAIVVIMLCSDYPDPEYQTDSKLRELQNYISGYYAGMEAKVEYQPPVPAGDDSDIIF
jgi:transcriptional regulator with XRE-family HTH domain